MLALAREVKIGLCVNARGGAKWGLVLTLAREVKIGISVSVSWEGPKWGSVIMVGEVQNGV